MKRFHTMSAAILPTLISLACLLGATQPVQATEVDGVVGLYPVGSNSAMAVAITPPEGQALSGVDWYHNDGTQAFPRLLLMEGEAGSPPDLANTAMILEEITGASLAWGHVDLSQPVTSSTGLIYAVFVFPENGERSGEGNGGGPGIGYRHAAGGPAAYASYDGNEWARFHTGYSLAVEPIYSSASGKMAVTTLAELRAQGETIVSDAGDRTLPERTGLGTPYPNPFNPRVEIPFELAARRPVRMSIFDLRGRLVATILEETVAPGRYRVPWLGRDTAGHSVSSGVYHVRMQAGSESFTQRVTLVR